MDTLIWINWKVTLGRWDITRRDRSLVVCFWGLYFFFLVSGDLSMLPGCPATVCSPRHSLPPCCSALPPAKTCGFCQPWTETWKLWVKINIFFSYLFSSGLLFIKAPDHHKTSGIHNQRTEFTRLYFFHIPSNAQPWQKFSLKEDPENWVQREPAFCSENTYHQSLLSKKL